MEILKLSIAGIPAFATHLIASLLLLALFLLIYIYVTPYREIQLIREGNSAASISLSGAMLGYAIPLAYSSAQSVNLADMILWGGIALVTQLAVYGVVRIFIIPDISNAIQEGKVAQGMFLGALSLATGLLNAGCMTY